MMRSLLITALLFASTAGAGADVTYGKLQTQGSISFMLSAWSNRPFVNGPQVPISLLREGVMVSVQSSNPVAAYQITIRYRVGQAILSASAVVIGDKEWASEVFYIGIVPIVSVSVTELIALRSAEFTE